MKVSISLAFMIGAFDPEEISRVLDLEPTWSSLDPDYRREGSYWCKMFADNCDSIESMHEIVDLLWPRREQIKALRATGISPSVFVSIKLEDEGNAFVIPDDMIRRLATLGASLEVEMYNQSLQGSG